MRASQCLDTHLNLRMDLIGRWRRISVRRSSLLAIISADKGNDVWQGGKDFVLLEDNIMKEFCGMELLCLAGIRKE